MIIFSFSKLPEGILTAICYNRKKLLPNQYLRGLTLITYIAYFTISLTLITLGIYSTVILTKNGRLPHTQALTFYLGFSIVWLVIDIFGITSQQNSFKLVMDTMAIAAQLLSIGASVLFIFQYLSPGKKTNGLFYTLIGLVSFFFILRLTNPLHQLFYQSTSFEKVGPFFLLVPIRGYAYNVLIGIFALWLGYIFFYVMTRKAIYQRVFYSQLSVTLYLSIAFLVMTMLTGFNILMTKLPILSLFNILPGIFFCLFTFTNNLLHLQPVAQENPLQELKDGVMSFSGEGIIVDLNLEMCRIIQKPWKRLAGKNVQEVFPEFTKKLEEVGLFPTNTNDSRQLISHFVFDNGEKHFDTYVYFTNRYIKATLHDVTNFVSDAKNTRSLAAHDPLTGIYNRRQSEKSIKDLLQDKKVGDTPYCFVVFDIDFFKQINDRFGHQTGDLILKEITSVFNDSIRPSDVFGRFGGDEFILLLHAVSPDQAEGILNRIQDTIRSHPFLSEDGDVVRPTISIGAITATTAAQLPYDDLFFMADEALYHAKEQGRDRVIVRHHTPFTKTTYL